MEGKRFIRTLRLENFLFYASECLYDIASENMKIFPVMCGGSRRDAYEDFKTALESQPEAFNVLLIDAESPVFSTVTPWEHLRNRIEDHPWILDAVNFENEQCHLMVQTMKAWFIADIDALREFYSEEFREDGILQAIARYRSVETISKATLKVLLEAATRNTEKGKYHKTRHAPKLLALLNATRVREASPYCDRLFTTLTAKMGVLTSYPEEQ
ncbi:DUF4276 family protein [Nostocaceae cyanobacterium CENA357]|uniref:DUF4276 family protein n=1 Tax=Atlanticothrix silvestris CENA357 TaxID=1725252 RepID=A0A8J7HIZ5_9CYAN|nr:DUF4276 family protein [Atlanticothrix silvestris]MBH8553759.1 DUF4276 family protein [Atlanticothrix silvestris CENA357]